MTDENENERADWSLADRSSAGACPADVHWSLADRSSAGACLADVHWSLADRSSAGACPADVHVVSYCLLLISVSHIQLSTGWVFKKVACLKLFGIFSLRSSLFV